MSRASVRSDRGSGFPAAIITILFIVVFMDFVVVAGRIGSTLADLQAASRDSARDASLAQSESAARGVIDVDFEFSNRDIRCQNYTSRIGGNTDFKPGGWVEVEVSCDVALSDMSLLPVPGQITVTRSHLEPIDFYRTVG